MQPCSHQLSASLRGYSLELASDSCPVNYFLFASNFVVVVQWLVRTCEQIFLPISFLFPDYVLCRWCGSDLSPASYIINFRSPTAINSRNQTIFGLQQVFVQSLENPLHIRFETITVSTAHCIGKGDVSNSAKLILNTITCSCLLVIFVRE